MKAKLKLLRIGTGEHQMENKSTPPPCPLCGGEVKEWRSSAYVDFLCTTYECRTVFRYYCSYAEAITRFSKKPESAWEKAFKNLIEILQTKISILKNKTDRYYT